MEKSWKLLKIEFGNNLVIDNNKYIKTKIKTYNNSMIAKFHSKKCQKENLYQ